jgi:hypothetical protein
MKIIIQKKNREHIEMNLRRNDVLTKTLTPSRECHKKVQAEARTECIVERDLSTCVCVSLDYGVALA